MWIYKCGWNEADARLLREALTGTESVALSPSNITEQERVKNLVSLLTDDQKWDFLRVIGKLWLDAKEILWMKTPEEMVAYYREKVWVIEKMLGIRPIVEAEFLLNK